MCKIKKFCFFHFIFTFIEPDVVPPFHCDEISEPLVCELVRDDNGDPLLGDDRGLRFGKEKRGLAVGDQAPILHCAGTEVGNGD